MLEPDPQTGALYCLAQQVQLHNGHSTHSTSIGIHLYFLSILCLLHLVGRVCLCVRYAGTYNPVSYHRWSHYIWSGAGWYRFGAATPTPTCTNSFCCALLQVSPSYQIIIVRCVVGGGPWCIRSHTPILFGFVGRAQMAIAIGSICGSAFSSPTLPQGSPLCCSAGLH